MALHPSSWITRGFDAFRRGTFGNAGQNLYVSRAGVLQRIHLFDANQDGYADLVFCNSQEFWEAPPAYVYTDPLQSRARVELRSDGSSSGVVADLNGDGLDDLVLGMEYNGARKDLNAFIYFNSPTGLTERFHSEVPAPSCTSVAAGDFNGDGRVDLAFLCAGKVRLFLQTELGFESKRFSDLPVEALQMTAADLDGDGFADLYCLRTEAPPRIYWGGPDGINPERFTDYVALPPSSAIPLSTAPTPLPPPTPRAAAPQGPSEEDLIEVSETEKVAGVRALAKVVRTGPNGAWHAFVPGDQEALLVPVHRDRTFGAPLHFDCPRALAVSAGDVNGDGHTDLVFAARDRRIGTESSWIYWGSAGGFSELRKTPLRTRRACDVVVGDLDSDGCAEIVFCQSQMAVSHSFESPIFRGTPNGVDPTPLMLPTEGARRVFIVERRLPGAECAGRGSPPDARSAFRNPQYSVVFINFRSRRSIGDAPPTIFFGGPEGFCPDRKQEFPGIGTANAILCDVNDDGRPDLITANSAENAMHLDPGSFLFLGGPAGIASKPSLVIPTRHAWGLAVADINRDGFLDLIVCCFQMPNIFIYFGGPDGFDLAHPQVIPTEADGVAYDEHRRLLLADLNNDGWLDLVFSSVTKDRTFILWGGPEGFDWKRRQALAVVRPSCPEAADLTGSGYLDLIIGSHAPSMDGPHDSFVYIYWNGPDGIREDRRTQLPARAVLGMAVADFNRDGFLDILACSYRDARERDVDSLIYWGGADRNFTPARCTRLRTHSASGCLAADFNEDGWVDVAIANHKVYGDHKGESFVWWNGPDGFDRRKITRLPTVGPHGMMRVQPGNQRDRGPEEYYESEPFELPVGARPRSINWQADLQPKTWVRAQLRTAVTRAALPHAPWLGPAAGSWFERGDSLDELRPEGHWIQYRLALGATNGGNTPRVREVKVEYA